MMPSDDRRQRYLKRALEAEQALATERAKLKVVEAERDRLRKALQQIANMSTLIANGNPEGVAQAALTQEPT